MSLTRPLTRQEVTVFGQTFQVARPIGPVAVGGTSRRQQ